LGKGKHRRRDRYWQLYDLPHSKEISEVVDKLAQLVDEAGDPWTKARRCRQPVHSTRKMVVICILSYSRQLLQDYGKPAPFAEGFHGKKPFQTTVRFMKPSDASQKPTSNRC